MDGQSKSKRAEVAAELGAISQHEVYPLPVFQRLTGLAGWALRRAERNGLKVRTVGRRRFVRGEDFAAYLANAEDTNG